MATLIQQGYHGDGTYLFMCSKCKDRIFLLSSLEYYSMVGGQMHTGKEFTLSADCGVQYCWHCGVKFEKGKIE